MHRLYKYSSATLHYVIWRCVWEFHLCSGWHYSYRFISFTDLKLFQIHIKTLFLPPTWIIYAGTAYNKSSRFSVHQWANAAIPSTSICTTDPSQHPQTIFSSFLPTAPHPGPRIPKVLFRAPVGMAGDSSSRSSVCVGCDNILIKSIILSLQSAFSIS